MWKYIQTEITQEWNKVCCFLNADKHWLCDEKRNQRRYLSAGAKLFRQGTDTDIQSNGKWLLPTVSEIRDLPSSPGTGWRMMKATLSKKKQFDGSLNDWFCTSEDVFGSQFKQKGRIDVRTDRTYSTQCLIIYSASFEVFFWGGVYSNRCNSVKEFTFEMNNNYQREMS